jgi:hypothetical protein
VILVVKLQCLLNVRWNAGARWRGRGGVGDAEAMSLCNRAVERTYLLKAPIVC